MQKETESSNNKLPLLSKDKFISIIKDLEDAHNIEDTINKLTRNSRMDILRDFGDFCYLTANENIIIYLLCTIFNDYDIISWWIDELNFGKDYKDGCITHNNKVIDLSSAEKLYDYLVENM